MPSSPLLPPRPPPAFSIGPGAAPGTAPPLSLRTLSAVGTKRVTSALGLIICGLAEMVAPPEPAPAARPPAAAETDVILARFSMVAVWWWPGGLLPEDAAAVPGGGGICMTPGRIGMEGGGRLLCEPS